ncbi:hypothetical protein C943_01962 [Mariniradius saccharolyticus AK6]|uniref:Uncharacterized protein n=1 Tax=Mariniradius saccharolyticus AK6 TaxID=1239962 RepID=M7Y393_9BACT|nr:hypothetical protein C943_01962 [Mariniradius saccharolyticus AK6]
MILEHFSDDLASVHERKLLIIVEKISKKDLFSLMTKWQKVLKIKKRPSP